MARFFKRETAIKPKIGNTLRTNDSSASERLLVFGEQEYFDERAFGEKS